MESENRSCGMGGRGDTIQALWGKGAERAAEGGRVSSLEENIRLFHRERQT